MKLALAASIFLGSPGASAPTRPENPRIRAAQKSNEEAVAAIAADAAVPRRSAARASAPVGSARAPTADDGILASEEPGREAAPGRRLDEACAPEDVITCVNGFNGTDTCEDACGGQCCNGTKACLGFTGAVCKDGKSCVGEDACYRAGIDSVTRGCNGTYACAFADIGSVMDGCDGVAACNGARVESVVGGCIEVRACQAAGSGSGAGVRNIGSISESCAGDYSCRLAAYNYVGGIVTISGSCNAKYACYKVGYEGDGTIPEMADCCNTAEECQNFTATKLLDQNCAAPSAPPSTSSLPSASSHPSPTPSSSGKPSLIPSATPSVSSQPSGVPTPVPGKSSNGQKSGKSSGAKGKGKSSKHGAKGKSESIINLQYIAADASMSMSMSFDFDFDSGADTGIQQFPRERAWG